MEEPVISEDLIFLMGKYEARFPNDRYYVRTHMWCQPQERIYRLGFGAYAVRLLQDVYFLDWSIEPDTTVEFRQEIGEIESSKAISTIHAPASGKILRFNHELMQDPTAINTDCYGRGWLFEIESNSIELLTAADYLKHLAGTWDETQQLIKGQMHD